MLTKPRAQIPDGILPSVAVGVVTMGLFVSLRKTGSERVFRKYAIQLRARDVALQDLALCVLRVHYYVCNVRIW
jgi:hypothetical protein